VRVVDPRPRLSEPQSNDSHPQLHPSGPLHGPKQEPPRLRTEVTIGTG
jgi:hypothetical protein